MNATEGGRDAILALADGDLRRVLNLLQSASMAYPQVTEDAVYLTAGAAMPKVIEAIYASLMNDGFEDAYRTLLKVYSYFVIGCLANLTCQKRCYILSEILN